MIKKLVVTSLLVISLPASAAYIEIKYRGTVDTVDYLGNAVPEYAIGDTINGVIHIDTGQVADTSANACHYSGSCYYYGSSPDFIKNNLFDVLLANTSGRVTIHDDWRDDSFCFHCSLHHIRPRDQLEISEAAYFEEYVPFDHYESLSRNFYLEAFDHNLDFLDKSLGMLQHFETDASELIFGIMRGRYVQYDQYYALDSTDESILSYEENKEGVWFSLDSLTFRPVPEPSSVALFSIGLLGLVIYRRKTP